MAAGKQTPIPLQALQCENPERLVQLERFKFLRIISDKV